MQKDICITFYDAICNLGNCIDDIFSVSLESNSEFLTEDCIGVKSYFGKINKELPPINDEKFNIRCNRILLYLLNKEKPKIERILKKYNNSRIGVVVATTNTGVEEFSHTNNSFHAQLGNPALFLKKHLKLNGFCQSISTACSSGIKAFSTAKDILDNNIVDAVIVAGVDSLSKLPIYGFNSLEVLSEQKCNPFSINRNGINIGEAGTIFILEKGTNQLTLKGIGETTDAYHQTTPEPTGEQAKKSIISALKKAKLSPNQIDYINLHGTGTIANDLMEANIIDDIFSENIYCSSTKSLTGHCLGAAAALEVALCCHCIKNNVVIPHCYDGFYDKSLPTINLPQKPINKSIDNIMCNAFGFGGTNAVIIIGKGENID